LLAQTSLTLAKPSIQGVKLNVHYDLMPRPDDDVKNKVYKGSKTNVKANVG
jgi:hypothetical protein